MVCGKEIKEDGEGYFCSHECEEKHLSNKNISSPDATDSPSQSPAPAPTVVKVLGGIWLGIGVLMVASSLTGFASFLMIKSTMEQKDISDAPVIFHYFHLLLIIQLFFAVFVIYSSYKFLKLKAWARKAIEVVNWLGLLYVVGFGIFWEITLLFKRLGFAESGSFNGLTILMAVMGIFIIAAFGVPLAVMIHFLRSQKVREAANQ
jgi:hypothetical protein